MIPPESVNVVVGFFMGFSGLLFSGGLEPIEYYGECVYMFGFSLIFFLFQLLNELLPLSLEQQKLTD